MTSQFIIDVSEADFELQVIAYSQTVPVVVDFWAEWCGPCRTLGPTLERFAEEGQGNFRLAKVNVDENPNLAIRYNVRSIPSVKAFKDGKIVADFMGAQPEAKIREFLNEIAPDQGDLKLEKARSLLDIQQPIEAENIFREVLVEKPHNSAAMLGLARSLLFQGQGKKAEWVMNDIPASKEFAVVEKLRPLSKDLSRIEDGNLTSHSTHPLDATYHNSLKLVKLGNFEAAMDGLLDILREDKSFNDGQARLVMIAILEMLGENSPLTKEYRSEMASVLF